MAIKILPSNIFDINYTPIPSNTFVNVLLNEKNYNVLVGNVTASQTFTFYELKQTTVGENIVSTVPIDVTDKNNVEFTDDAWIEAAGTGRGVVATLNFPLTQKTIFSANASGKVTSHSLRRETTIWSAAGGERKVVSFENPFAIKSVNDKQVSLSYSAHIFKDNDNGIDEYILQEVVSIEGQYFENADGTTAIYDDSITAAKNILKLPSNELVQGDNTYGYKADAVNAVNYSDKLVAEVFERYKNGKETATLLCSVGKYYDLDGNLVVDAENEDSSIAPLLKKYDIVVPYVMTSRGEAPLSTDASGNPKQFQIIGVNISYNGIPRQEIVIQEYAT